MPITQDEKGKWHWGTGHGSFDTREGAERQQAAAYAHGYKEKSVGQVEPRKKTPLEKSFDYSNKPIEK